MDGAVFLPGRDGPIRSLGAGRAMKRLRRARLALWQWRHCRRADAAAPQDMEISNVAAEIDRLAAAAAAGSLSAAARLTDLAEDRVGIARRDLARTALDQLLKVKMQ